MTGVLAEKDVVSGQVMAQLAALADWLETMMAKGSLTPQHRADLALGVLAHALDCFSEVGCGAEYRMPIGRLLMLTQDVRRALRRQDTPDSVGRSGS